MESLSQLADSTSKGLRELSQHPIQYTSRAIKEFVSDYWDLGLAIAGGAALGDHNDQHFGNYRDLIMLTGISSTFIPSLMGFSDDKKKNRSKRNLYGLASVMAFSWGYNYIDEKVFTRDTICFYLPSLIFATESIIQNSKRKKVKQNINNQPDVIEVNAVSLD